MARNPISIIKNGRFIKGVDLGNRIEELFFWNPYFYLIEYRKEFITKAYSIISPIGEKRKGNLRPCEYEEVYRRFDNFENTYTKKSQLSKQIK